MEIFRGRHCPAPGAHTGQGRGDLVIGLDGNVDTWPNPVRNTPFYLSRATPASLRVSYRKSEPLSCSSRAPHVRHNCTENCHAAAPEAL